MVGSMDKYQYKAIPWAYVKSKMCANEAFLLKCIMETDCYLINYKGSTQVLSTTLLHLII